MTSLKILGLILLSGIVIVGGAAILCLVIIIVLEVLISGFKVLTRHRRLTKYEVDDVIDTVIDKMSPVYKFIMGIAAFIWLCLLAAIAFSH